MKVVFCIIQELNNHNVVYVETIITSIVLMVVHKGLEILIYVKIFLIIEIYVKNVKMNIE